MFEADILPFELIDFTNPGHCFANDQEVISFVISCTVNDLEQIFKKSLFFIGLRVYPALETLSS